MKKEIKELKNLVSDIETRLKEVNQKIKTLETEPETRLWNVDEIVKYTGVNPILLSRFPILKLVIVAKYCNEIDDYDGRRYFPTWFIISNSVGVHSSRAFIFATPTFNSSKTIERLISENTEFFTDLLKPKE